jgi:hypothetical protein
MDESKNSVEYCIMEDYIMEDCMSINEIKKIKDQKLVEESDNRLTECLFSNDPHKIDKYSKINIVKIDKDKFISVINKKINPKKILKPSESKKQIIEKRMDEKKFDEHDHYDLNDYSYNYCDDFDIEDKYLNR